MLSPLPALLTPGNLALSEAAATVRDNGASGADFASLMQRQSDRQAALRDIDQQMARPHRPADTPRPAEAAPARAADPDGPDDAAAQQRRSDDAARLDAEAAAGQRQRQAASAPATPAVAPRPASSGAVAGADSMADDGAATTALPAGSAGATSATTSTGTTSTTQWARSRLAARAAAGGQADPATPAGTGRLAAASLSDPAGTEVTGGGNTASGADSSAGLAPAALPTPPLPWPPAQAVLPPADTATPTTQDLAARSDAQVAAATLAAATSQHPAEGLATRAVQPGWSTASAGAARPPVGTAPALAALATDTAATGAADTAGPLNTAASPTTETMAANLPAPVVPAAAGAAPAAAAAALATRAGLATAAAAAAVPAVTAPGSGRPAGRVAAEPAGRAHERNGRGANPATDLARAAGQQPVADDQAVREGAAAAGAADMAGTSATAGTLAAQPAATALPAANAAGLPSGLQPVAGTAATDPRAAAERADTRPAGASSAVLLPAAPATTLATPDLAAQASAAAGVPAPAAEPGRPRDDAGGWLAAQPAGPAPAAGLQAAPAAVVAEAASADRSVQATVAGAKSSARAEAVADLASSFNALPLAPQGGSPAVAMASSSPAVPVDAHVPVPLDDPGFGNALGTQVSVLVRDGVQTARLQLNPAELGPIAVQIALDGSAARVDFQADLAGTRAAIEASLPALAGALQDAGFTLAGGGVSQQTPGRQGQGDAPAAGQPRQADGGTAAGSALPTDRAPLRAQRGLVDLVA